MWKEKLKEPRHVAEKPCHRHKIKYENFVKEISIRLYPAEKIKIEAEQYKKEYKTAS